MGRVGGWTDAQRIYFYVCIYIYHPSVHIFVNTDEKKEGKGGSTHSSDSDSRSSSEEEGLEGLEAFGAFAAAVADAGRLVEVHGKEILSVYTHDMCGVCGLVWYGESARSKMPTTTI